MKTYKEQETGVIEWREKNGESVTIGLIREGETRTRETESGETETYSPWDELLDSGAGIQWRTDEDKAAEQLEQARAEALAYLARTDWYYSRLAETGQAVPVDVVDQRTAARELLQ